MIVRRAADRDVPVIRDIVDRAYGVYVERMGRRPAPLDDDYERKTALGQVFVAETDTVVGLIVLIERPDHLLIENVAVDPALQGRGVGRALMGHAEGYAREHGLGELRLYTNEAMHENLRLYPLLGYREDGRRVEDGFRRVYFSKRLEPETLE